MGKIRNPLDALKNPKEAFQHPLKALPIETKSGALGPLGQKGTDTGTEFPAVPAATPPVTLSAREVVQAGMDLRQQQMMKKNIRSTIKAGDTGGFRPTKAIKPAGGNPMVAPQGNI